jgi:hypothetical protein
VPALHAADARRLAVVGAVREVAAAAAGHVPAAHVPDERGGAARRAAARVAAWGDNAVSSCRSYSRAKCPGAFPVALSLSGEGPRGPRRGAKGCCGTPGAPLSQQPRWLKRVAHL